MVIYLISAAFIMSYGEGNKERIIQQDRLKVSMERGKALYRTCAACHNKQGEGYKKLSPPLAKSDYLKSKKAEDIIRIVKFGLEGEIVVNGEKYNGKMPAQPFNDQQIADVLNYVRNSFGNQGAFISKDQVAAVKSD